MRTANDRTVDDTTLVDGYGLHLYPNSATTLAMVEGATCAASDVAAAIAGAMR